MLEARRHAILLKAAEDQAVELNRSRRDAEAWGRHQDWPWNGIILSAATRGGSARWVKVSMRYDNELSWTALAQATPQERRRRLETVGRFWRRTADWLEQVWARFEIEGGPAAIREKLKEMDAGEIISFWKSFPNIGDKYARNLMMDAHDPRFRQGYFAIDSRIQSLLPVLALQASKSYDGTEEQLRGLAASLGLDCWTLDRLLYQCHDRLSLELAASDHLDRSFG